MKSKVNHKKYNFLGKVWKYKGPTGWHFVTLPKALSIKIRKIHGCDEEGWGRLKTTALVGQTKWQTTIWYDTKSLSYILPIKAAVRKIEEIRLDSAIKVILHLQVSDSGF